MCAESKPSKDFGREKATKDGLSNYCLACKRAYNAALRASDLDGARKKDRDKKRFSRYGITQEVYQAMYQDQAGQCAICDDWYEVLSIDHCHSSKVVRGLLCKRCNFGLGQFRDDTGLLARAIEYLALSSTPI